jgi:hypothetical protein
MGLGIALAGLLVFAAARPTAAAECATAADEVALRLRALQTELMVAALACERREAYNDFVDRFRPALQSEGQVFKAYFRRLHGGGAEPAMNRFVTQLANFASQRSIADRPGFCAAAGMAFADLAQVAPADLRAWIAARPAAPLPGIGLCAASAAP